MENARKEKKEGLIWGFNKDYPRKALDHIRKIQGFEK